MHFNIALAFTTLAGLTLANPMPLEGVEVMEPNVLEYRSPEAAPASAAAKSWSFAIFPNTQTCTSVNYTQSGTATSPCSNDNTFIDYTSVKVTSNSGCSIRFYTNNRGSPDCNSTLIAINPGNIQTGTCYKFTTKPKCYSVIC